MNFFTAFALCRQNISHPLRLSRPSRGEGYLSLPQPLFRSEQGFYIPCILTTDIENAAISAETAKESVSVPRALVGKIDVNTPPFSLKVADDSMASFGVKRGGHLIINPAERADDFDIIFVAYKSKTAIKRFQKMPDGAVRLLSPDGGDIDIPKEYIGDRNVFRIIGKAVLFEYSEMIKLDRTF